MEHIGKTLSAYTLFVIGAVFAYSRRTEHCPLLGISFLVILMLAVDVLLPRWASLLFSAAIALPLVLFLGAGFWALFTHRSNRTNR